MSYINIGKPKYTQPLPLGNPGIPNLLLFDKLFFFSASDKRARCGSQQHAGMPRPRIKRGPFRNLIWGGGCQVLKNDKALTIHWHWFASIHFKKDSEHDDGNTCVFSILMERNHNCLNSNVGSQLVGLSGETVHYNGWPGGWSHRLDQFSMFFQVAEQNTVCNF